MRLIITLLMLALFFSCYKERIGCIDKLASNYDVSADQSCEEAKCCVYPDVSLKIDHTFNNEKIEFRDTLFNQDGSPFYLLNMKVFITNIQLFDNNKAYPYEIKNKYFLKTGDMIERTKDYVIVENNTENLTVNQSKLGGKIDKLSFTVGVDKLYDNINIKKADSYLELSNRGGMYDTLSKTYKTFTLNLIAGPKLKDTINVTTFEDFDTEKIIAPPAVQNFGQSIRIPIVFDYNELFEGINFREEPAKIKSKIFKNIRNFTK